MEQVEKTGKPDMGLMVFCGGMSGILSFQMPFNDSCIVPRNPLFRPFLPKDWQILSSKVIDGPKTTDKYYDKTMTMTLAGSQQINCGAKSDLVGTGAVPSGHPSCKQGWNGLPESPARSRCTMTYMSKLYAIYLLSIFKYIYIDSKQNTSV